MTEALQDVSRPGPAFARQAAAEAHLLREAEAMLGQFLSSVLTKAKTGTLYPPDVHGRWATAVADMLDALPSEMAEYVGPAFRDEDLPSDVYSTVQEVYAARVRTMASAAEMNDALERALSPDGFEVEQVSASIGQTLLEMPTFELYDHITQGAGFAALVAAGFWDNLEKAGSVWVRRIRRTVRTTATGMVSRFTVTALRIQDYPKKKWVTRHDDHVRSTHRLADGQVVPTDQPFIVGGASLMYPGERDAEYGEVVNCRCTLVGVR
ncbi:portal protein [Microbacterium phage Hendrix]|uniref:MuF-like minor capsid protein n=1 Tax=Microbacterium phage Hendrix TaxID=2182341 RepID=A0A2U8UU55_9CAUD|nr:portal protein [Microbacterium phage Hendrix]AWN07725.1 MuF-like minor capsid protein [Microbacterium phage Hendrix]